MEITFKDQPVGPYTEETLKKQWSGAVNIKGVNEGRCEIVDIDGEHVLQVTYVKGKCGPQEGGASWRYRFGKSFDEATLEYKVMVSKDFNFRRGGKLPGLCGGTNPRGGTANISAKEGFSARIMWRELGLLMQYVYYIDQSPTKKFGTDFLWMKGEDKNVQMKSEWWKTIGIRTDDRSYLDSGVWYTFKTCVKMNTPGMKDGSIMSWLNGNLVLDTKLRFRNDASFAIDSLQFATYFGGSGEDWAPEKDEKIYFKDLTIT